MEQKHSNKDDIEQTKLKQQEYKREKYRGKENSCNREIEREASHTRKHVLMILEAEKSL